MIEQKPKYTLLPSGEPIIFTTYHSDVLTHYKVKYIAYLYVFVDTGAVTQVATVKVSPNSTGRGIFDFSKIIDDIISSVPQQVSLKLPKLKKVGDSDKSNQNSKINLPKLKKI